MPGAAQLITLINIWRIAIEFGRSATGVQLCITNGIRPIRNYAEFGVVTT